MTRNIIVAACLVGIASMAAAQDTPPPPPPPPQPPVVIQKSASSLVQKGDIQDFYKRNPSVNGLRWQTDTKLIVTEKNQIVTKYDLSNDDEVKSFEKKYGKAPVPPPPPPPPPAPPKPDANKS